MLVDGKLRVNVSNPKPLEELLHMYEVFNPELLKFLRGMLRILPQDRLSARELLSQEWLYMRDPNPQPMQKPAVDPEAQSPDGEADRDDAS